MNNKVSIIIRTKNEERWITACLNNVFSQDYKDFEVILVDSKSADKTIEKAKQFPIKDIIQYGDAKYFPGKALNMGIRSSSGDFIVCLSGHCIPSAPQWLQNLLSNFQDPERAGAYGRQEPMLFSSNADKRDLAIAFGLDKKIQKKDPFFHNANSMIRKDIWRKFSFDETVTNIEDRVWAQKVLDEGYNIAYEPEASVYHYHGIHQNGDVERCTNVVRILEDLHKDRKDRSRNVEKLNVIALVPVRGPIQYLKEKPLLHYTLKRIAESKHIKRTIVSTDNKEVAELAKVMGAEAPFIRNSQLSGNDVSLAKVYQYSLHEIEDRGIFPDIVACLEITFPFRPPELIDNMILELAEKGLDSVVAAKGENKAIWKERCNSIVQLDDGLTPRQFKDPTFVELRGVGCITHPELLRKGDLFGNKIGIYEVNNPYSHIEVRNEESFKLASLLIKECFKE